MPTLAGHPVTSEQIRGTIQLLNYYGRFLRSGAGLCCHPEQPREFGDVLTRTQAQQRLGFLVNTAINRKAGIPDVQGRKQTQDYWWSLQRDRRRVHDRIHSRIIVRRFETPEFNRRFAHLLHEEN